MRVGARTARARKTRAVRLARLAGAAVLAVLLAACATYQPAPIEPGRSAARFNARRLGSDELRQEVARLLPQAAAEWPPADWDRARLLAVAMVWNPRLAVARAQVEGALAHEITARELPNPQLALQTEYARREPHPWLYGLSLDVLLLRPQTRRLEAETARLETSGARWELMDRAWSVRSMLLTALSDRESATRRLAVLDRLASSQDRLVEVERRRVAAGEDAADALLLVGQARLEIRQSQAQARSDEAAAEAALAAALGVPPAALAGIRIEWPDWGTPPAVGTGALAQASEQALRARSDLGAALDAYAAAENRLHEAVLRQYPQFHFSPGYYWDHGISKFPLDVGFDLPFNRNRGAIAEARAARDLAGKRMLATQAGIIGAIGAAESAEKVAREGAEAAQRALDAARTQRRNSAASLRLGAIAVNDDLAAEILALRSELGAVEARARWQAARNALEDALHAPLSGPELQLARPLPAAVGGAR